jgi:tRNA G18 (ribose-2'-O)-methylase SpoU
LSARKARPRDIRRERRRRGHSCWDHLVVAPLWVAFKANLGTLLRTCDAVGACIAVPDTIHYRAALKEGDTLGPKRAPCVHWIRTSKESWIERQRSEGWQILAVELAEGAVALPRLEPARQRTVILLAPS